MADDNKTDRNERIEAAAQAERDAAEPEIARSLTIFYTNTGQFGVQPYVAEGEDTLTPSELVGMLAQATVALESQIHANMLIQMGKAGPHGSAG